MFPRETFLISFSAKFAHSLNLTRLSQYFIYSIFFSALISKMQILNFKCKES